ncbi:MAG: flavodoxin family protein, partial [Oscillospiraceae bacterium]
NGSPHADGSTFTALNEIAQELVSQGIEAEILHIGTKPLSGCIACEKCGETHRCIFDDVVNIALEKAKTADGFIFGSPVYYASANGSMVSFMDRLFYAGSKYFAYKPAASIVAARRAGTTATYDQLNKYIGISRMIMIPSVYWNMVIGHDAKEVKEDLEGIKIMRTLGKNMAWMLKVLESAKENGIEIPEIKK